ncbi:hypothetical protein [Pseudonocardia sp. TRM90224]|uniref:hypothetical protein n=1 Tax=Pseudonocardia sp. TRM90224 TaxID=2812678 RepID=UPI001E4797A3|nr:hypothetical protein [Pseudonocardia sp. TRM90224]
MTAWADALGFHYGTGDVEDPALPSGAPGTRAAHLRLRDGRSSLDLIDPTSFTTVDLSSDQVVTDHLDRWRRVYQGGIVVRPDGVIASRGIPHDEQSGVNGRPARRRFPR